MYRGYIKLWRKSLDKGWLKNSKLWWFWCWCLLKASHKEYDLIVGYQTVHLMPGDFVFGLHAASKETFLSVQEIRTSIDFLKKDGNLTIKTTNKFSIISIVNWDIYQGEDFENNKQSNKPLTNKQQTTNNKQECKELKNEKNIFIIPTVEQVRAYCQERKNQVNPDAFIDFYTSNGWLVGKNKMKDWKAAVRTWEKRGGNGNGTGSGNYRRPGSSYQKEGRGQGDGARGSGILPEYRTEDLPLISEEERLRNLTKLKEITG